MHVWLTIRLNAAAQRPRDLLDGNAAGQRKRRRVRRFECDEPRIRSSSTIAIAANLQQRWPPPEHLFSKPAWA
jgi:hypothetical protein